MATMPVAITTVNAVTGSLTSSCRGEPSIICTADIAGLAGTNAAQTACVVSIDEPAGCRRHEAELSLVTKMQIAVQFAVGAAGYGTLAE
jgi:hypothetical protein